MSSTNPRFTIRLVDDVHALRSLAGEWADLHRRMRPPSPFTTPPWIDAWWTAIGPSQRGARLHTYVAELEGRIAGIAPCYLRTDHPRARILRMLGDTWVGSEYLDLIAAPEHRVAVAHVIAEAIRHDRAVDAVQLIDLSEDSPLPSALGAGRSGLPGFALFTSDPLPVVALHGSLEKLHASWSSSMRYGVGRKQRALMKRHPAARLHLVESESELRESLEILFSLHAKRWHSKGQLGNFIRPEVRAFHRLVGPRLLQQGSLHLWRLELDHSRVAAVLYALRVGDRELYLQAGMDPAFEDLSPGMCLMSWVIERCAAEGLAEFDMLRGTEAYKMHWATAARRTLSVRGILPTARGMSWIAMQRVGESTKSAFRRRLSPASWEQLRELRARWRL